MNKNLVKMKVSDMLFGQEFYLNEVQDCKVKKVNIPLLYVKDNAHYYITEQNSINKTPLDYEGYVEVCDLDEFKWLFIGYITNNSLYNMKAMLKPFYITEIKSLKVESYYIIINEEITSDELRNLTTSHFVADLIRNKFNLKV